MFTEVRLTLRPDGRRRFYRPICYTSTTLVFLPFYGRCAGIFRPGLRDGVLVAAPGF